MHDHRKQDHVVTGGKLRTVKKSPGFVAMRPPRPASTILPAAISVTNGRSYTIADKFGYRRQSSMSKAPEPPPTSSNFRKPPKSTASPRARAVKMESECMACQKVAIIAGSAPSKSDFCLSGSQVVGLFVRTASGSLSHPV